MSVDVIIPTGSHDDEWRCKAAHYVQTRLELLHPDWSITTTSYDGVWCKAAAVALAIPDVDGDVLIVHDADVVVDPEPLRAAVTHVEDGIAGWAMPHEQVHRLTQTATEQFYADSAVRRPEQLERRPYRGVDGGGIVVLPRATYDAVPLDRRFLGWGGEDRAWGMALTTLHGPPRRGRGILRHLWHAHPSRDRRTFERPESLDLLFAYERHVGRPEMMAALIEGGR